MSDRQEKLYKILGSMLREARLEKGYTLEQVGEQLGVIAKTVQRYETGERKISLNKIMELTSFYGIDYTTFMNTAKKRLSAEEDIPNDSTIHNNEGYYFDEEVAKIAQEVYERPELRMLFSASRNVSADDLKAVIAIVDRMKKEDE